jgi:hypothetical protein
MNANALKELPALVTPVVEIIVAEHVETIDRSIEQIRLSPTKEVVKSGQNTTHNKKCNRDDNTDPCCFVYLYFLCQPETIEDSCCSNTSQCLCNTCQCCFEVIGNMNCDCDDD